MNTRTLTIPAAMTGLLAGSAMTITGFSRSGARAFEPSMSKHDCKGRNNCKGQGGCKSGDMGCKGKNSCKGKGGCKVA